MGDAPPVEVRGLLKRYGSIVAVDDVDLTVERGDVFGYLGPNGAGKTTSLRMMLGLIRPTAGHVRLFGRDPQLGVDALEGVAGFVEAPRFYPYLSGRKNLELLAALDGDGAAARIDEVLEVVELAPRARHKVGGYSHGMRQRLGIAAALLRRPRLLILDEPATGLDPAGMRDMRTLIRRLAGDGRRRADGRARTGGDRDPLADPRAGNAGGPVLPPDRGRIGRGAPGRGTTGARGGTMSSVSAAPAAVAAPRRARRPSTFTVYR